MQPISAFEIDHAFSHCAGDDMHLVALAGELACQIRGITPDAAVILRGKILADKADVKSFAGSFESGERPVFRKPRRRYFPSEAPACGGISLAGLDRFINS